MDTQHLKPLWELLGSLKMNKFHWLIPLLCLLNSPPLYAAPPGNAASFNGGGAYVQIPGIHFGSADFTIEGWIKPSVLGGYVFTTRSSEGAGDGSWFALQLYSNKLSLELAACNGGGYRVVLANSTLSAGNWYHIAVVRNSTTFTFYINGIQDGQVSDNASLRVLSTPHTSFGGWVGYVDYTSAWYNGQIDEFRIWNVARTQAQIQSNLHKTLIGNEAGLLAYYNFDETSGGVSDRTGHGYNGALFGATRTSATWKYGYPYVTTDSASGITPTTAILAGTVIDEGTSPVTARGICYATTTSPTAPCTTDGSGVGTYTTTLSNLTPQGTTYYTRAYATNSTGTNYSYSGSISAYTGNLSFVTRYIPVINQTDPISVNMSQNGTLIPWASPTITATDGNNDPLTWTLHTPATLGTATVSGTGASPTITYVPNPDASGIDNFIVQVADADGTDTITVNVVLDVPEASLKQGTTLLNTGSTHDFGTLLLGRSPLSTTFTLANLGTYNLLLTGNPKLTVSGPNPDDFRISGPTLSSIASGAQTEFTVTFAPTSLGSKAITISIPNNDGNESPYILNLQGQGLTPLLKISQAVTEIPNGHEFNLGEVAVQHQVSYPFTIENSGNTELHLVGDPPVSITGAKDHGFTVDTSLINSTIPPGAKTQFTLNFQASNLGPKTASLTLFNDDLTLGNYSLDLLAQAVPYKNLYLELTGTGQGSINSNLAGMTCQDRLCQQPVIDAPQWVYLEAVPAAGSRFTGWEKDTPCQAGKILILEDTQCRANFELNTYQLTIGTVGRGTVQGPGLDCPPDCTESFLYGTDVKLEAQAKPKWRHSGWQWSCDSTGQVQITDNLLCHALFELDFESPNFGDGNADGILDAYQDHVISLSDKVTGNYVTLEVQPESCPIRNVYTDLPENYGQPDRNKPSPQGVIYFELDCAQAQISLYYHAVHSLRRNFIFQKFGTTIPGDENSLDWFLLPNVRFELVKMGEQSVVKAVYTLTDGELGDNTPLDGRIIDPVALSIQQ